MLSALPTVGWWDENVFKLRQSLMVVVILGWGGYTVCTEQVNPGASAQDDRTGMW